MGQELPSVDSLNHSSRWDGSSKRYTRLCPSCQFFQKFQEGEVCLGGVAWKFLSRDRTSYKCQLLSRPKPEEPRPVIATYTPQWIDFVDGTVHMLEASGWSVRFVPRDNE